MLLKLSHNADVVLDVDEEVFILYSRLPNDARNLGYIDSTKDTITVELDLLADELPSSACVQRKRKLKSKPRTKSIQIEIAQDKTSLQSRKGDTGSVLWKASVDFAQAVLQQQFANSGDALFDETKLSNAHILELGAGTGLLSLALSPLVKAYTVTDMANLMPLIRKNLKNNGSPSNINLEPLDWLHPPLTLPASIDLILSVDCIYNPSLLPAFVKIIDSLATIGTTEVLIVIELRSEEVVRDFLRLWLDMTGWTIRRIDGLMPLQYAVWAGRKNSSSESAG